MLARGNRLTQAKDFHQVLSGKRGVKEGGLLVKATRTKNGASRVGIVVSKKVSKKAVERNRIRRVLQETVRKEIESIPQGVDIALVVMPTFKEGNSQDIHKLIHTLVRKALSNV